MNHNPHVANPMIANRFHVPKITKISAADVIVRSPVVHF